MSLLNQELQQVPTKEQRLQDIVNRVKRLSASTYRDLVRTQQDGIDAVWYNRDFTPQEIIDALGDDAVKVFAFHGKLTDLLVDISAADGVDFVPAFTTAPFTVSGSVITVQ